MRTARVAGRGLVIALVALMGAAPIAPAQTAPDPDALWERYPLRDGRAADGATAPADPAPTQAPAPVEPAPTQAPAPVEPTPTQRPAPAEPTQGESTARARPAPAGGGGPSLALLGGAGALVLAVALGALALRRGWGLRLGLRLRRARRIRAVLPVADAEKECRVVWARDRFAAVTVDASGHDLTLARSPSLPFSSPQPPAATDDALDAYAALLEELTEEGWEPVAGGRDWYARRFHRREEQMQDA